MIISLPLSFTIYFYCNLIEWTCEWKENILHTARRQHVLFLKILEVQSKFICGDVDQSFRTMKHDFATYKSFNVLNLPVN